MIKTHRSIFSKKSNQFNISIQHEGQLNSIHTFLICGNCDVLLPSNSSIFCFYHVLGDKISGYLPHGDHPFFNFWVVLFCLFCFVLFCISYVLEMYLKKGHFLQQILKLLLNSKFLRKLGLDHTDSGRPEKSQKKLFFPSTHRKPQGNNQHQPQ